EKLSSWLRFDTPKMLAIDTAERVREVLPALRERFAGRVKVATSNPKFIEFVSPKAGKAVALERLSQLLSIPKAEIIAFGDGLNDLDMLEWAGTSYAMENGAPEVKARADFIAPSNAEDGVAQVVERLIREGQIGGGA
ncbi:MAG: HAD-IIB family hydrolase, partial [Clostridia bacterium]|nr:HAD-IIB family hydrolase [Clostridia bacterium]